MSQADATWYIHHNNAQQGPLSLAAARKWLATNTLTDSTLIFCQGWTQWKPFSECSSEIMPPAPASAAKPAPQAKKKTTASQAASQAASQPASQQQGEPKKITSQQRTHLKFEKGSKEASALEPIKQERSPRSSVQGQIIVHNNDNLIFAQSVNISAQGLFIQTEKPIFNIGEILKITCRVKQLGSPFNAEAQVVRRAQSSAEPSGYGLFFTSLKPDISERIHSLIRSQQKAS